LTQVAKFDGKTLSFPDGKAWTRVSGLAKKSIKNKAVVGTSTLMKQQGDGSIALGPLKSGDEHPEHQ
jgi:hypothetical protein